MRRYLFTFETPSVGEGQCWISRYYHKGKIVVVCAESTYNIGSSITNAAEVIATEVWRDEGYPPLDKFVWIEHYQTGNNRRVEDTFDLTTFELAQSGNRQPGQQPLYGASLRDPHWKEPSLFEVELLIAEQWTPLNET